ncbi:MAG TPA: hypothetical protein VFT72_03645 [Opitutaceae bacterium]|nr:hypothetical protein [Opitutaceae bacterium]
MSNLIAAQESALPLRIAFSSAVAPSKNAYVFAVDVPFLAGVAEEEIFPPATLFREENGLSLYRAGDLLIGCGFEKAAGGLLEGGTRRLYQRIIHAVEGRHLYRMWNYVSRINAVTAELEHYRAFCRGRSISFETALGTEYKRALPAASAVGSDDDRVAVVFVAGSALPKHVENPEQVPAYDYPEEHGPRSPSFSRATIATADGQSYVFVSGTAAIKGHATIPGDLAGQVATTRDNLRLISQATGIGDNLGAKDRWTRHFKVYLRNAADLLPARALLEGTLLQPADRVTWLRSDICRAALNIEIEATLVKKV